jgi:hypothetical protein
MRVPGAVRHPSCRSAEPGPMFALYDHGPRLCSAPLRKGCALRCVRGTDYPAGANDSARAIAHASLKRTSSVPSISSPGRSDG